MKTFKRVVPLITAFIMLLCCASPVFAASTYPGSLHPGSMTVDDDSMSEFICNTYFSVETGRPPEDYNNYRLIAEIHLYYPAGDIYQCTYYYYDPTKEIPAVKIDESGSGFYKIVFPYSYTGMLDQSTGTYTRAGYSGSTNQPFCFDKPVNPTAGTIGTLPYGTYQTEDSRHSNLLAVKWYTTPDLTQLGSGSILTDADFNMNGLEVIITPSLKLGMSSADRSQMDDGTEWDTDYFDVMIINNTDSWYQVRFGVNSISGLTNGDFKWICNSSEWNYADKITDSFRIKPTGRLSIIDGLSHTAEKQFGNSEWHVIGGHSAYEQMIQWDDLNLEKNKSYTFFVEAVPAASKYACNLVAPASLSINDDGTASCIEVNAFGNDVYHEYDKYAVAAMINYTPVCIFSTLFSLSDPPVYNPNNDNIYNGSLSNYTPIPEDGKPSVIEDLNGNIFSADTDGFNYDYDFNVDDVSLSDMKGLIDSSSGFVGLFQGLLGIFPAFVWIIIAGGLTAIVILRILGR